MAEPRFADDDDLPRTLRRERDAREREKRERELSEASLDGLGHGTQRQPTPTSGYEFGVTANRAGTVTRLEIPFVHLMLFFMKAVVAAIPALILLTVLLWGMGQGLKAFFPQFRHFEIVVKSIKP